MAGCRDYFRFTWQLDFKTHRLARLGRAPASVKRCDPVPELADANARLELLDAAGKVLHSREVFVPREIAYDVAPPGEDGTGGLKGFSLPEVKPIFIALLPLAPGEDFEAMRLRLTSLKDGARLVEGKP